MFKKALVVVGLLLASAASAAAQTVCSNLPLASLLGPLADNVPAGSITPRNIRDVACSAWNQGLVVSPFASATASDVVVVNRAGVPGSLTAQQIANLAPTGGGGGGAVSSVFGRIGPVTAQSGDYTAPQVGALAINQNLSDLSSVTVSATNLLNGLCVTQGSVAFRGLGAWQCLLPGTNGQALTSGGPGANIAWASTSGSVASVFGRTASVVAQAGDYSFSLLNGQATFAQLPNLTANTVLGNSTNGTTTPTALTVPACLDVGGNHINWTNGTGFTCGNSGGAGGGVATVTSSSSGLTAAPTSGNVVLALNTPVRNNTATTDTILSADGSGIVTHANTAGIAVTLPQAGSAGFASGYSYCDENLGAGLATITPTTSTINNLSVLRLMPSWFACPASNGTNYSAIGGFLPTGLDAVTAHAGGGQGSATALTNTVNHVTVVATTADSVKLVPAFPGFFQIVTNDTANNMQVFGSGTDTINNVATGTGVVQNAGITTLYSSPVAGKWYATSLASGGGGSVTSVALTLPSFITVTGSPITSSGTLTGTLATQSPNTVFAGPASGGVAAPTFRSLVAADFPAGLAQLAVNNTWTKGQAVSPFAMTDAATIAVDATQSNIFTVTLSTGGGASRALGNPTGVIAGQNFTFFFTQDGTGSRALTYGANFKFAAGSAPVLTTAASALDVLSCVAQTTSLLACQMINNVH